MRDEIQRAVTEYDAQIETLAWMEDKGTLATIQGGQAVFRLGYLLQPIVYLLADIADSLNALAERHGDK